MILAPPLVPPNTSSSSLLFFVIKWFAGGKDWALTKWEKRKKMQAAINWQICALFFSSFLFTLFYGSNLDVLAVANTQWGLHIKCCLCVHYCILKLVLLSLFWLKLYLTNFQLIELGGVHAQFGRPFVSLTRDASLRLRVIVRMMKMEMNHHQKTSQELRMLSSVTLNCQVNKDCQEIKFSIVRNLISVSNVTSP